MFGHTDFFKHNVWFEPTNRQMVETVSQHAQRIRQYGIDEGNLEVERFLDAALAISDHIDPYPRRERTHTKPAGVTGEEAYNDLFPGAGPSTSLATGRPLKGEPRPSRRRIPPEPEKDLLHFLIEHADHLDDWQRDVLSIVRAESLYFIPQMQTKIMNEGWASFWHNRIMREIDLTGDEFIEFGRLHSGVCTPARNRINPYYVGLKIFEDIERRLGREKIFEVRELENDASFIRSYLTEELCEQLDLFVFKLHEGDWKITDKAWERIRDTICDAMTNFGHPYIVVLDGDYGGKRELYLQHQYDGRDLDLPYAERTLNYLYQLWGRPVHIETRQGDQNVLLSCDGDQMQRKVT